MASARLARKRRWFAGLCALLAMTGAGAQAQSNECARLQQAIANASSGRGEQYQAAAERKRAEADRLAGYARSAGCDNRKFLFFGSDPPAQCGGLQAQIGQLRGAAQELQARAGGGDGGRGELMARYNAQCAAPQPQQGNIIDVLLGNPAQQTRGAIETVPVEPKDNNTTAVASSGGKAVCVRTCDGSFFPVSYAAGYGGGFEELCHALCPNADVSVYTYPNSGEIEQAVSLTGARYMDSPSALKYRQSFDSSCSCRRRGESWSQALAGAEARFGNEHKNDILVTEAKSAELSRPRPGPKPKPVLESPKPIAASTSATAAPSAAPGALAPGAVSPADQALAQQAAAVSREASGIAAGDAKASVQLGANQGKTVEIVGPDGVKRRVRIIDPAL